MELFLTLQKIGLDSERYLGVIVEQGVGTIDNRYRTFALINIDLYN